VVAYVVTWPASSAAAVLSAGLKDSQIDIGWFWGSGVLLVWSA
jgi:hypothetical protein